MDPLYERHYTSYGLFRLMSQVAHRILSLQQTKFILT